MTPGEKHRFLRNASGTALPGERRRDALPEHRCLALMLHPLGSADRISLGVKYGFMVLTVALAVVAGCARDGGDYRNVGASPQDWELSGPGTETRVFGPMPYDQVKEFVRAHEASGWSVVGYDRAGEHLDGRYLVTLRRWK